VRKGVLGFQAETQRRGVIPVFSFASLAALREKNVTSGLQERVSATGSRCVSAPLRATYFSRYAALFWFHAETQRRAVIPGFSFASLAALRENKSHQTKKRAKSFPFARFVF